MSSGIRLLTFMEAASVTGPAKHLFEFWRAARELRDAPEVQVATFQRGSAKPDEFIDACKRHDLTVHVIQETAAFDLKTLNAIRKLIREQQPDVLQTNAVKSHFLVRLSKPDRSVSWVAMHHGYTTTSRKMRAYNQLDRWSLASGALGGVFGRPPDRVLTVSKAFHHQLCTLGVPQSRITVLHNPIYPDWLTVRREEALDWARAQYGILPEEAVILAVGRLSHEKAHVDLVSALAETPLARLVIVGEGPERQAIEALIRQHNLGPRVTLAGHQSDVGPYFARADVFALPSLSEGSPYVLLEAMSAGVPIVASAVGGIPEMVSHEHTALLTPPSDPAALAGALRKLLNEPAKARSLAEAAREAVVARHSPGAYAQSLLKYYGQGPGK